MFDVGFAEIVLVMVIALLVVGPERLPRLARTAGLWLGKARAFVQSVREDIEREVAAEELKRVMRDTSQLGEEVRAVREIIEETDADLRQATALSDRTGQGEPPAEAPATASGAEPQAPALSGPGAPQAAAGEGNDRDGR